LNVALSWLKGLVMEDYLVHELPVLIVWPDIGPYFLLLSGLHPSANLHLPPPDYINRTQIFKIKGSSAALTAEPRCKSWHSLVILSAFGALQPPLRHRPPSLSAYRALQPPRRHITPSISAFRALQAP